MKNMKIKVENNLDEIVVELERLGWVRRTGAVFQDINGSFVIATNYKVITWCGGDYVLLLWPHFKTTTLAELQVVK